MTATRRDFMQTAALVGGIPVEDDVLFVGGGALNTCLEQLIGSGLGRAVHVPEKPQLVTARGCALWGQATAD